MTQEAQLKACPDEDWFEEVISDSLEMDWRPRDAAKAIVSRWSEAWYPEGTRTPDSVNAELVEAARRLSQYEGHHAYCRHIEDDTEPCVCGYLAAHERVRNALDKLETSK